MKFEAGITYDNHYVMNRTGEYITVSDPQGNQKRYKISTSSGIETANKGRISAGSIKVHRPGMGCVSGINVEAIIFGYAEDICKELGLDVTALYASAYPSRWWTLEIVHQDGVKATVKDVDAVLSDLSAIHVHDFREVLSKAVSR